MDNYFFPISAILSLTVNNNRTEQYFYILYHLLVIIWNSKAFELTKLKRVIFVIINLLMFYGILGLLVYKLVVSTNE